MLYILHGDDLTASRRRMSELSSDFPSVDFLQGDKTDFSQVVQKPSTTDLFAVKKCLIIEQILKLSKADLDKIFPVFEKVAEEKEILLILWQGSEMTKIQVSKYKKAFVENFMLPKLFFTFLDNFTPRNSHLEIKTLLQMKNVDALQIFYALIKRIRQLIMLASHVSSPELTKMSPWQLSKLKVQSEKWKSDDLEYIYKELFNLEVKLKSGGLMLPLKNHLDILIASALH